MKDENKPAEGTPVPAAPAPSVPTPAAAPPAAMTQEELNALEKDLNMASDNFVSKDVQDQIKVAKDEARKEAEKEFATNQKIKELQEQLAKKEEDAIEVQKQTAEQLGKFKEKLDNMASSKAVVSVNTPPFKIEQNTPPTQESAFSNLSEDSAEQIEKASFEAILARK